MTPICRQVVTLLRFSALPKLPRPHKLIHDRLHVSKMQASAMDTSLISAYDFCWTRVLRLRQVSCLARAWQSANPLELTMIVSMHADAFKWEALVELWSIGLVNDFRRGSHIRFIFGGRVRPGKASGVNTRLDRKVTKCVGSWEL